MSQYQLQDLLTLMARLREPQYGCPWDLKQTYQTIAPSTIEEAYEVVDAIEKEDVEQLKEELGDLLFQVVFYSQLGREENKFDFNQIVSGVTAKLIRRHPHVFPEGTLDSRVDPDKTSKSRDRQQQINASWEQTKQQEREQKGYKSALDDIPTALPAISRAYKLQKRAARVGFDWEKIDGVYEKLQEEIEELKHAHLGGDQTEILDEVGDLLFSTINLARHLQIDPETALRRSNNKFESRFRCLESLAIKDGNPLEEKGRSIAKNKLEAWWQQAKQLLTNKDKVG